MKDEKFARLFDLGFSQVLLTIEPENDKFLFKVKTMYKGAQICMSAAFIMQKTAKNVMDEWDEQRAILFRKEVEKGTLWQEGDEE